MARESPTIDEWKEPEKLILLQGWSKSGLSMLQIAKNIGISRTTLYKWQSLNTDIKKALTTGREIADYQVENALFLAAITGNVTAQIFWLKNRKPEQWRDKVEQKIETDIDTSNYGVCILPPRLPDNEPPKESED